MITFIKNAITKWQIKNSKKDIEAIQDVLDREDEWLHSSDKIRLKREISQLNKHVEFLEGKLINEQRRN